MPMKIRPPFIPPYKTFPHSLLIEALYSFFLEPTGMPVYQLAQENSITLRH
jgi:hypothetical protein